MYSQRSFLPGMFRHESSGNKSINIHSLKTPKNDEVTSTVLNRKSGSHKKSFLQVLFKISRIFMWEQIEEDVNSPIY